VYTAMPTEGLYTLPLLLYHIISTRDFARLDTFQAAFKTHLFNCGYPSGHWLWYPWYIRFT